MAKTIPQLTDATTVNAADELIVQQGGITKRATGAELAKGLNTINGTVNVKDFGAVGDGVANDTAAIQAAIDAVHAAGGGTVFFPPAIYSLGASSSSEVFDNGGSAWPASSLCLIVRPRVSLIAHSAILKPTSATLTCIGAISPSGSFIKGFEIDSSWSSSGAGHGILQLQQSGEEYCRDFFISDCLIKNIGSYAIGIQNGDIDNVVIQNISITNCGADGIDIKRRGPANRAASVKLHNIYVESFGQRTNLVGQAGIDVRGDAVLTNIHVYGVGQTATATIGIRFRTYTATSTPSSDGSSLCGFFVSGNNSAGSVGVNIGSPNVAITSGTVYTCQDGVFVGGNANGLPTQVTVTSVSIYGAGNRGFFVGAGSENLTFIGCSTTDCPTGFRIEALRAAVIGCRSTGETTSLSLSTAATAESQVAGSWLYGRGLSVDDSASGLSAIRARGTDAAVDILISPKGAGNVRYGTHAALSGETLSGYITIKDSAGNARKLAVVS